MLQAGARLCAPRKAVVGMLMIRNGKTGEVSALALGQDATHPQWVHEQCATRSEAELQSLLATLDLGSCLRAADDRGIFVRAPPGALAWKRADPFQSARWLFEESAVLEALELDPDIVVWVPEAERAAS
jgi:hypothetical protein